MTEQFKNNTCYLHFTKETQEKILKAQRNISNQTNKTSFLGERQ